MTKLSLRRCLKTVSRTFFRILADRNLAVDDQDVKRHIVLPRWDAKLGDAILSSFFLREVASLNIRVTVLTVPELVTLHQEVFGVDRVLVTSANPGIREFIQLARKIGRVDAVVHLVGRLQPAEILFIRLLRPATLYSLDDALRCVNRKLGKVTANLNVVDRYRHVLYDLGASAINSDYIVPLPAVLPASDSAPQILFNPWASRLDKSLSEHCAVATLRAIAAAFPLHRIGIIYGPASWAQTKRIEAIVSCNNVQCITNIVSPTDVAGYMCRAQVVISVDTAIVHLAVGLKKRLIAIYPGTPEMSNPWLPPISSLTTVIYSPQFISATSGGKKNMNNFSLPLLLDALKEKVSPGIQRFDRLSLRATIVPGLGVATGTLARQLPLIAKEFPEIADCFPGTLNLKLELPLEVIRPDHRTPPLAWTPSGRTLEVFDLLRIELEFAHLATPVDAWLYVAHGSPHRATPDLHEVITRKLAIGDVRQCRIHLSAGSAAVPADAVQASSANKVSLSTSQ